MDFETNLRAFPAIADAIKCLPRPYEHSFLSALSPGTHITPHFGPTNKKLRCMLPLTVPQVI
jgi:aspartate beta-hydroxylase